MSLRSLPVDHLRTRRTVGEFVALLAAKGVTTFDVEGFGSWTAIDHTQTYNNFVAEFGVGPANGTGDDDEWVWIAFPQWTQAEIAAHNGPCLPHLRPTHAYIGSSPTKPPQVFLSGTPNPCTEIDEALIAVSCSNAGTNLASDYSPWAGDNEERVEITTASAIPAGNTVIAVVGATKVHGATGQVYDERGNTWTKDADYENTQSSGDNNVQIWRCNVTADIQAGDYIRFAWNLGSSLVSSTETGGRCIGAYAYSGTLSVSSVGTGEGDGQFNGAVTLDTPAGDVVVAGLAGWSDFAFTEDADWQDMVPHTYVTGSGDLYSCVFAQHRADAGATTWDLGGSHGDWAAISVGYTRS